MGRLVRLGGLAFVAVVALTACSGSDSTEHSGSSVVATGTRSYSSIDANGQRLLDQAKTFGFRYNDPQSLILLAQNVCAPFEDTPGNIKAAWTNAALPDSECV